MPVLHNQKELIKLLKKHNVDINNSLARSKFYKEYFDWDDIANQYQKGESIRSLCKKLNLSYDVVRANLIRKGVKLKSFSNKGNNKYKFNFKSLEILDYKGAYLLGWLYSDGYVGDYRVSLVLQKSDKEHLEYIKNLFTDKPLRAVKNGYEFTYYSTKLVNILRNKYNFKPRKSCKDYLIYFDMDKSLLPYLILGLLEGDGSINKYSPDCSILLPKKSLNPFLSILENEGIDIKHQRLRELNSYGLMCLIFKGKSYFEFLSYVYRNTPKIKPLNRKFEIFNNQLIRSMEGRTSPYKSLARNIWDSLTSIERLG